MRMKPMSCFEARGLGGAAVPGATVGDGLLHILCSLGAVCIPSTGERCPLLSPRHSTPGDVQASPLRPVPRSGE